jgi:hypothetical protein
MADWTANFATFQSTVDTAIESTVFDTECRAKFNAVNNAQHAAIVFPEHRTHTEAIWSTNCNAIEYAIIEPVR